MKKSIINFFDTSGEMRGLRSIWFSQPADIERLQTGLLVQSCSDLYGEEILRKVRERMPHVRWSLVKRFEPGYDHFSGKVIFSSYASTISKKISFIRKLRQLRSDITVVAWTGEKSYNALKFAAYLSNFRYLLVYNEHYGAFFAVKKNRSYLFRHLRWRMRNRQILGGKKPAYGLLSWIVLYPPALVFIIVRTFLLVIRKYLRRI
jgi:hypothetical protein